MREIREGGRGEGGGQVTELMVASKSAVIFSCLAGLVVECGGVSMFCGPRPGAVTPGPGLGERLAANTLSLYISTSLQILEILRGILQNIITEILIFFLELRTSGRGES